jgi:hypothetical protein
MLDPSGPTPYNPVNLTRQDAEFKMAKRLIRPYFDYNCNDNLKGWIA